MTINIRHIDWLRSADPGALGFSARLHETLLDLRNAMGVIEQQTNSDASGTPAPPPRIQSMTLTPTGVGHHVSINHGGQFYRGCVYHVETADNPHFTNPFPAYTGPAREIDLATGNQTLYAQAWASYQNSDNSSLVFHGGRVAKAVTGGVSMPRGTSQGGGTGQPGTGHAGYGPVAYRGSKPPARGK